MRGNKVATVLPAIGMGQLDAGDLGHGVPLVGWLQRTGEQSRFRYRLGRVPRIDARRAYIDQPFDAVAPSRLDDVRGDHHVVVEKFSRGVVIGENAADAGGDQENRLRTGVRHPGLDVGLAAVVDARLGSCQFDAFAVQPPDQGPADHAGMAGDEHPFAGEIVHA